jgi:hypothetical protein
MESMRNTVHKTLCSLCPILIGKNESTWGSFKERKPGESQFHQAILQSVDGGFFVNQQINLKKRLSHKA